MGNEWCNWLGQPYPEQDVKLGHILLVYISCCLAGRAYPVGEISNSDDLRIKVKHQVLTCLTCLHSKRALEDESPYPYLRSLLEFNTQELLNALSLAFEESEFTGEMGARRQQRVIDILIEIMINSTQFSVIIIRFYFIWELGGGKTNGLIISSFNSLIHSSRIRFVRSLLSSPGRSAATITIQFISIELFFNNCSI